MEMQVKAKVQALLFKKNVIEENSIPSTYQKIGELQTKLKQIEANWQRGCRHIFYNPERTSLPSPTYKCAVCGATVLATFVDEVQPNDQVPDERKEEIEKKKQQFFKIRSKIDSLKTRAENFEKEVDSIDEELADIYELLHEHFNSCRPSCHPYTDWDL